jgi:hypothetical protein
MKLGITGEADEAEVLSDISIHIQGQLVEKTNLH